MNEPKKLVPPLAGQDFTMLGQVSLDFHAKPRVGATLEDVLAPSYWVAVASQVKPGCEIRVIPEDNSWYAKLLVLSKDSISANVAVILYTQLTKKSKVTADQFEVRPTQNNTKHGVFRKVDNELVKGGFMSEKQADDYISDRVRTAA